MIVEETLWTESEWLRGERGEERRYLTTATGRGA
jgi:hypothetical protein